MGGVSEASPPITHVRVARQTDRLEACVAFYRDDLSLPVIAHFEDHSGYTGVMLGLPGSAAHLELMQHAAGSPASASAPDDLLVLYLADGAAVESLLARLDRPAVALENPYWSSEGAVGVADPDGRTVVLVPRPFD